MKNNNIHDSGKLSYSWIKLDDGSQYICPIDALSNPESPDSEELRNCAPHK